MNLLRRLLPLLISLLNAGILLFLLIQPRWLLGWFSLSRVDGIMVFVLLVISLLSTFVALTVIGHGYGLSSRLRFYPFLAISTASAFTIFLYSDYRPMLLGLTLLVPAYTWIWLESLYLFWQQPLSYQPYTLQRLASYLYLLELFMFVAAASGIQVLFLVPTWAVILVSAVVYCLIQYDLLSLCRLEPSYALRVSLAGTILAVQLQLVLNTLPTQFLLYSGLMTLFFYAWIGLTKLSNQQESVPASQIWPYALISGVGAIATFVTSLWIV